MTKPHMKVAGLVVGALATLLVVALTLLSRICADCGKPPEEWDKTYSVLVHLKLSALAREIHRFEERNGRLPVSLSELSVQPFMDPWGREILFEVLPGRGFLLRSTGRDGLTGTPDDVVRGLDAQDDAEVDHLLEQLQGAP